ncbi:MAG: prolyl-tRNA synthetase associated domain-containing protein [Bacteroidales bacterium]|nr:prolyl-tRNA synthetase associated domain-containing protein [Bacteroidales bacterium]
MPPGRSWKADRFACLLMFYVSDIIAEPPEVFATELEKRVYEAFGEMGIAFERVDTDPGITMEDCQNIDAKIGVRIVKTIFLCNRQQTEFYLYVTTDDKPFVTREFCGALGIPRVSFASAEKLWELTGVEVGATTVLSAILPQAAGVHLVMDRGVAESEWFACTDGTATCFVKIRTKDLLEKYLAGKQISFI